MRKSKRKWRWVTRDSRPGQTKIVVVWQQLPRPVFSQDLMWWGGSKTCICYKEFLAITGVTIKPGEAKKVEFSAKEVK